MRKEKNNQKNWEGGEKRKQGIAFHKRDLLRFFRYKQFQDQIDPGERKEEHHEKTYEFVNYESFNFRV